MLNNFWNKVVEWFTDKQERNRLIRGFNNSARAAFVTGEAPTLLHASLSRGNSDYRHQFSHWLTFPVPSRSQFAETLKYFINGTSQATSK